MKHTPGDIVRVTGSDAVKDGVYPVTGVRHGYVWVQVLVSVTRTRATVEYIAVKREHCTPVD